jgi:hypothetical protein
VYHYNKGYALTDIKNQSFIGQSSLSVSSLMVAPNQKASFDIKNQVKKKYSYFLFLIGA